MDRVRGLEPWLSPLTTEIDPEAFRAVDRPLETAWTLPRRVFTDPEIHALELHRLFHASWHCLGRSDEWPRTGDYRTYEVGGSGVAVLRDQAGRLRAFHNVCRHRGTRLLEDRCGAGLSVIQCPYHAWTYDLEGRLRGAPHMEEVEFDREAYPLHPVKLEEWRGFVFVNLDPGARPLRDFLGRFADRAAAYPLERLRLAHRIEYVIAANWKLVVQNANECYHCPGVHPQLVRFTPYRSGEEDLTHGPVFGGWMDFVDGVESLTVTGKTRRAIFPDLPSADRRRVYYYVLYPGNFLSFLPDYVTLDRFIPDGPERTRLIFDLYVDRDEGDDASDAMAFWDVTNRQDWHVCELAHLGSKVVAYDQGRYASDEELVHAVDRHYVRAMGFPHANP